MAQSDLIAAMFAKTKQQVKKAGQEAEQKQQEKNQEKQVQQMREVSTAAQNAVLAATESIRTPKVQPRTSYEVMGPQRVLDQLTADREESKTEIPIRTSYVPQEVNPPTAEERAKAAADKARADYEKTQAQLQADREVLQKDMEALNQWPEEDRKLLEFYSQYQQGGFGNLVEGLAATMSGSGASSAAYYNRNAKAAEAFQALSDKYGADTVKQLSKSLSLYQNAEATEQTAQQAKEGSQGFLKGTGSSILSLGAGLAGSLTAPIGVLSELATRDSRYSTLDANNLGNLPNVYSGAVRQSVSEQIEKDHGIVGKVGAEVYKAGMSAADNLLRIAAAGDVGSLALAATGAFGQTVNQMSAQGATPGEAVLMGIVDGGLEVLTEKVSLDNLLGQFGGDHKTAKEIALNMLRSAGVEVSEEEASWLGSVLAEAAIMKGKSAYNQQIGELVAEGLSYEEAKAQADSDLIWEAAETAIQSGLSGGIMSGVTNLYSNTMSRGQEKAASGASHQTAQQAQGGETVQGQAETQTQAGSQQEATDYPRREDAPRYQAAMDAVAELGQKSAAARNPTVKSETEQAADRASRAALGMNPETAQGTGNMTDHGAVGAAERDFSGKSAYQDLLYEGNVQWDRPGDVRPMEVPKTDSYGRRVTEFSGNAYGAEVTPDSMASEIESLIQEGALGFDTRTNRESLENAQNYIYGSGETKGKGEAGTRNEITRHIANGRIQDGDIEKALLLYAKYANRESRSAQENAAEIFVDLATMANMSGRNLQLFKLLRRMTPEGQLMTVQKNITRYVDKLNVNRSDKKKAEVDIPDSAQQQYLEAAKEAGSAESAVSSGIATEIDTAVRGSLSDAAGKAIDTVLWNGSGENAEYSGQGANIQTNDMAERVGQRVADNLTAQARQANQSVEDLLYREIMRFANDKAKAGRTAQPQTKNQNLAALRDHYRYRAFFQTAWDIARNRVQETMNTMAEGDPRIPVIEQFLASGDNVLGLENETPVSSVDYANPESTLRRGTKEAATQAGIRMENRKTRQTQTVKQQMLDILVENAQAKEAAAQKIAQIAMEGLDLNDSAAENMANDIIRAFYADLADQSARRVASLFSEKKTSKRVQKTFSQKLEELYNMGAFSYAEYRQAALDSLFGEKGIQVPDQMIEKFVNAAEEKKQDALHAIYKEAAAQIKPTIGEMWDAWRNLSMLGNVKTHLRNVGATAAFRPYAAIKRSIGAGLESIFLKQENRTKSILGFSEQSKALLNWAKADAKTDAVKKAMDYSGTTGDEARSEIEDARKILPGFLDTARKQNMAAMEAEDMLFKRREYALSLASFLKARGYTAQQVQSGSVPAGVMQEGRNLAVQEAMKATFNDRNRFSDTLAKFRFKGNDGWSKALNTVAKGILPFTRTPANIVVRTVEYSPLELATAFKTLTQDVKSGKATVSQGIDQIASGLTGTGMWVLGAGLAAGLIPGVKLIGKLDDEDEERKGAKEYSIKIGDEYYGIEWLAPANIPLFIGANLYNSISKKAEEEDFDAWDVINSLAETFSDALDPMLELSVLSSFNDFVTSIAYEDTAGGKFIAGLSTAATSYFTQGLPTIFGQLEQATEETKSTVFSNADNPMQRSFEKAVGRATQRIPGIDLFQVEKVDESGDVVENDQNWMLRAAKALFIPFNASKEIQSPILDEIARLNQVQPDNVAPPEVAKTVTFTDANGERHQQYRLSGKEYTTLQKVQGQTAKTILESILDSGTYAALTDEQKAKVFGYVYDYAREKGRTQAIEGYSGMDGWMEGIDGKESKVILDKVVSAGFTDALDTITTGWREHYDTPEAVEDLDRAYETFRSMSTSEQRAFQDDAGGRLGYYLDARKAGIDTDTFLDLYQTFYDLDKRTDLNTTGKAKQWSYELQKAVENRTITQKQEAALKESMVYYQMFPAETEKFDQLTESGLTADQAKKLGSILDGLKPQEGYSTVRDIQKAEAISEFNLSEADRIAALKIYLSDSQDENLDQMLEMGFDSGDYVTAWQIYSEESGKGKKARTIASYQEEFGVDKATAAAIYEIYGG